jgi:hypothetical protein
MASYSSNLSGGTGNWSASGSWSPSGVPGEGDTATITSGDTITVDQNITIGADSGNALTINGILDVPYNISSSYSLTLKGNIAFGTNGEFKIGTSSNRLASDKTYTININYSDSLAAREFSFTVPTGGIVSWYGMTKTMNTTLASGVTAGTDPTITVADATGWNIGDIIILVDEVTRAQTEELTIKTGYTPGSTTVPLLGSLSYNKTNGHFVMNMSQNIIVKNYSDSYISYFKLTGTGTNQNVLSGVMLNNLGDSTTKCEFGVSTLSSGQDNKISLYKTYSTQINSTNYINTINSYCDTSRTLQYGFEIAGSQIDIENVNIVRATNYGIRADSNKNYIRITNCNIYSNSSSAISSGGYAWEIENLVISGINTSGLLGYNGKINTASIKYCSTYGVDASGYIKCKSLTCSNNTSGDVIGGGYIIEKCNLTSSSPIVYSAAKPALPIYITEYNGTAGDNRTYFNQCILSKNTTTYRTTSPALECYVNSTNNVPFIISGNARTAYVNQNKSITLTCYVAKDIATTNAISVLRIAKGTDGHGLSETAEYDIIPKVASSITVNFDGVNDKLSMTAHGLSNDDIISFTTTGNLPTGFTVGTDYYVVNSNTNDFQLSSTQGGSVITFSDDDTGTHKIWEKKVLSLGTTTNDSSGSGFINIELLVTKGSTAWYLYIDDLTIAES